MKQVQRAMAVPLLLWGVVVSGAAASGAAASGAAGERSQLQLSVKQTMTAIVAPATNTIWGAQEVQDDDEWQFLENAALAIIAACDLNARGGAGTRDADWAAEADWQKYNAELIAAARDTLAAIKKKDINALAEIGNTDLYSPCEDCHRQYMPR